MKRFLIIDRKNNTIEEGMANSIEQMRIAYAGKEIYDRPYNFSFSTKDLRYYNDDFTLKTLEQLIKIGLEKKLEDNEKIENNRRVKLTDIELYQKFPERLDKNQILDKLETGEVYIREKTLLEKYNDNIITKEEYNNAIDDIRQGIYAQRFDGKQIEAVRKFALGLITKAEYDSILLEIQEGMEDIKRQYPKM